MCGIAGILGHSASEWRMNDMLAAMHHRGPDDKGIFTESNIVLGHKRLSIIDLSSAGHQPMHDSTGRYTMVYNGEVYNYHELQQLLPEGTILKSTSDSEVILELWRIYGKDTVPKLRGMFAIAIWDHVEQTLTLARDHMGIKPLYYAYINQTFVFASEMKGMLASELIPRKVNQEALSQYLQFGYIIQPSTFIDGISMLAPASILTFQQHQLTIESYWDFKNSQINLPSSEEQAIEQVQQLLEHAVSEETISDRPLGVFLSGGLDSTVIVAALKNSGIKAIKTFSVGFDGDDLSEEDDAKTTAEFYHTDHTQLQVSDHDIVPHIEQYIQALDQPSVDGLNTWLVSKVTSKHVTVALSGLGGDELFSGYSIDRKIIHHAAYMPLFRFIHQTESVWRFLPGMLTRRLNAYKQRKTIADYYSTWGQLFTTTQMAKLTGKEVATRNPFRAIDPGNRYSILQRISQFHLRGFMMCRLLRDSDAVSMDHSLEVRFPLIDYRLVQLSYQLPDKWKLKHLKDAANLTEYEKQNSYERYGVKHLLYQAFKQTLPPNFGSRPKRGFKMPIEKWMRGGLMGDITHTLSNTKIVNQSFASELFQKWKMNKEDWMKVWALYIIEKWANANLR